eukprot:TRINITY_DN16765_c0_g1_i1.p1 TRINITY_DN16765_c0_g1~~TRINITY_DN16765_c0_g1_i1.p1  ORF type:complete len:936 (+),score=259.95 TRINITY_DN16765_c0_g1_i1:77-2884(+)
MRGSVAAGALLLGVMPSGALGVICRVDALWHGPGAAATDGDETASIQTVLGPLAAARGWYEVAHAAVGCGAAGCPVDEGQGCARVRSGGTDQCMWAAGAEDALRRCAAWPQCSALWCGPAADVANSSAQTCWARSGTDLLRTGAWRDAVAYLPATTPNSLSAACSSQGCGWTWAVGELAGGNITLRRSDGAVRRGAVSPNCSAIHWSDGGVWRNLNAEVSTVHVLFMAHFDVGYTMPSVRDLIDLYATSYFPTAFNTSRALRARGGPERFRWTSHPWLIEALLRNQTGNVSPAFVAELDAAIRRGDVVWHANPMNMQSEAGERLNMEFGMNISRGLDARYGQPHKVAASQKDEPGATLGMVDLLSRSGVQLLHVGANDFSTVPALPSSSAPYHGYCNPFDWRDSASGNSLTVLYCSGYSGAFQAGVETPNMMTVIPGFDHALAYLMHVDNRGPQTPQQALEGWAAVQRAFPNARVVLSSMDEWAAQLAAARPRLAPRALPAVSDVEPGSTWIYGISSQPRKMRWYRAAARAAAAAVRSGAVDPADPRLVEFHRLMLKIPEHTWGDGGPCEGDYTNAQFHNPIYPCRVGGPSFMKYQGSWTDQRDFVPRAVAALGGLTELRRACESAIAESEPQEPVPSGWAPFDWAQAAVTADGVTVRFAPTGAVVGLGLGAAEHASSERPLGLLQYATHSEAELDRFGELYTLQQCAQQCGHCGFGKCGLHKAGAESRVYSPNVTAAWADTARGRFLLNLSFAPQGAEIRVKYGAPAYATIAVNISAASGAVRAAFDLQWFGKPPTRMAESLWMTFAPAGTGAAREGWEMDKMGRWVDPLSVAVNGSRALHGVWSGVRRWAVGPGLGAPCFELETLDAPVVSPGVSLSPTGAFNDGSRGDPHPEQGWSFNLFNNAWSTNYALWSLDAAERFRWVLTLRDGKGAA